VESLIVCQDVSPNVKATRGVPLTSRRSEVDRGVRNNHGDANRSYHIASCERANANDHTGALNRQESELSTIQDLWLLDLSLSGLECPVAGLVASVGKCSSVGL